MSPRAVRDDEHAELSGAPRVGVRGETDGGLVRERDDLEPTAKRELVEEIQDEVARKAEDVADAEAVQVGDQEVAERHLGLHAREAAGPHKNG